MSNVREQAAQRAAAPGRAAGIRGMVADSRLWNLLVAVAFTAATALQTPLSAPLGWDEAVYASQVSNRVPMAWTAPRGRGMPLLNAPVTLFTANPAAIRIYFLLLSGACFYLMLWTWGKVDKSRLVPVAGAVFGSLWITANQASSDLGNLYLAYSAAIAAGAACWYQRERRAAPLVILLAASFTATMVHGPTDGVFLLIGVLASLRCLKRKDEVICVTVAGVALGVAEWCIEAWLYFGGPAQRVHLARQEGSGLGFFLPRYIASLGGGHATPALVLCWAVLLALAGFGLYIAWRSKTGHLQMAGIVGAVMLAQYLVFLPAASARYFLPAFALWSLPVAAGLLRLLPRNRLVSSSVTACLVALAALAQHPALSRASRAELSDGQFSVQVAESVTAAGVRAPCLVAGGNGTNAVPIAYYAGCSGSYVSYYLSYQKLAEREQVAVIVPKGQQVPAGVKAWQSYEFRGLTVYYR